jgi:undecaprenyl-phosphate galactose phosphotransferase/putative colanic acid biosynthesis UDP-glucose lipid carrier transferase
MTVIVTPRQEQPAGQHNSEPDAPRPVLSFETISRLLPIVDLAIIIGASILAVFVVVTTHPVYANSNVDSLYGLGLIASGAYVFRMRDVDFYDIYVLRQPKIEFRSIIETWSVSAVVLLSLVYLFKLEHLDLRRAFLLFALLTPLLLVVWRLAVKRLIRYGTDRHAIGRRNVIVIGEAGEFAAADCDSILDRLGVTGATRFALESDRDGPLTEADRRTIETAIAHAQQTNTAEAFVMAGWSHSARLKQLRGALRPLPIGVRLLPDRQIRALTTNLSEGPTQLMQVELQRPPLTDNELLVKRWMDLTFASLALVVLALPLLVVAALIRWDSPGPAIFRQQRIGFNRRAFTIYKFRTMRMHEDGPTVRQARKDDDRVTHIGRFLRATSIDELPQLLNVLRGDMSLVGPRPHAVAHDDEFEAELAEYAYRRRVKPGITGWAQCQGKRGPTPTVEDVRQRMELDLWYITNWSAMLDIYILAKTVLVLFGQKNAF